MKVAIIMPLGEKRGGGEKRLWDLMREGQDREIEWLVIFQQDGSLVEDIRNLGIEVRVVPSGRLRQPHVMIASILQMVSIVKQEQVDVILSWMWKPYLYGFPVAALTGVTSLWSQLENPNGHWLKNLVTALPTDGMFINSQRGKKILEKAYPNRPLSMVYPGVALNHFDPAKLMNPAEIRQKLGLPVQATIIGIVGRLQRWKGMHVLLDAMPGIIEQYPDAHCLIVGGKHKTELDYENYLRERVQVLGIKEQVIMVGHQQNIPEWMQSMDIIVHASNNEPFGIVVVEAMALGKPIIAANNGGPTEIITHGENGLLTPYGDVVSLQRSLLKYLSDRQFAHRLGMAAQKRAADFSTERYVEKFIQGIYDLTQAA